MVVDRLRTRPLGCYWRTARHLRPVQVFDRVRRRWPRPLPGVTDLPLRAPAGRWRKTAVAHGDGPVGEGRFRFLGLEAAAGGEAGWEPEGVPRLWRYHLHYFDRGASGHLDTALAADWMAANPPLAGTGWEPYPLSRRIPNWIMAALAGSRLPDGFAASLAGQATVLSRSVEYHLLGNHLLANLRALLFAGCYFAGPLADAWRQRALREWDRELDLQILGDGGHQERSPMYHALVLSDLLDLIQLAALYPGTIPPTSLDGWRRAARQMLAWLEAMLHPDGRIPFFQDASFGMAPEPAALAAAAAGLGCEAGSISHLDDSGYARLAAGPVTLLADLGTPAPAHQPGHAHAAALAFELSLGRERLLVNTGTSTYEPGARRHYERSTEAHNTLRAGGRDQSEMWAEFRVGARAVLLERRKLPGEIQAAVRDRSRCRLERRLRLNAASLTIGDRVEGPGDPPADCFLHLHPAVELRVRGRDLDLRLPSGARATVVTRPPAEVSVEPYRWSPGFGQTVPAQRIRISHAGGRPVSLQTEVYFS